MEPSPQILACNHHHQDYVLSGRSHCEGPRLFVWEGLHCSGVHRLTEWHGCVLLGTSATSARHSLWAHASTATIVRTLTCAWAATPRASSPLGQSAWMSLFGCLVSMDGVCGWLVTVDVCMDGLSAYSTVSISMPACLSICPTVHVSNFCLADNSWTAQPF